MMTELAEDAWTSNQVHFKPCQGNIWHLLSDGRTPELPRCACLSPELVLFAASSVELPATPAKLTSVRTEKRKSNDTREV